MRYFYMLFLMLAPMLYGGSLEQEISYNPQGPNKIGYLHLPKDRGIDQSTLLYVKYALDHFREQKTPFIVLHLDTPGGEVFSAMKIAELLKEIDAKDHIPVVAFIDNWAISAGAMLAYSCRFIGSTHAASMGAAEPVLMNGSQTEPASEKVNSALRSEFSNLANYWKRNPDIAEAMVDKDIILVMREGKLVRLQDEKQIDWENDEIITNKGKLLTLNAENLAKLGVVDFQANSLLQHPFFAQIPEASFEEYHDWKIDFFSILLHPMVSSLLYMGLMLGIYLEIQHPGAGLPAALALSCLALILMSSFAIEVVRWMEIILLIGGLGLLVVEFFVLPGFGVPGVLGIVLTIVAMLALSLPGFDAIPMIPFKTILNKLAWLCGAMIIAAIGILMSAPKLLRRFMLSGEQEGYLASSFDLSLVGREAVALSELKPSGHIVIEGKSMQAMSETGFIDKDQSVEIVGGRGGYLLVKHKEKT